MKADVSQLSTLGMQKYCVAGR